MFIRDKLPTAKILLGRGITLLRFQSLSDAFGYLYLALLVWGVTYGIYYSWNWPLYHDAPIMHYIASRILDGAVPYRDIFDMNMPGTYLLHMLCISVFGRSDLAFRMFDLFWCALAFAGIAAFGWKQSKIYACVGGLFFVAIHFTHHAGSMLQRDFLQIPFLMFASCAFVAYLNSPEKKHFLVIFGVLSGLACWIKPVALVFVMLCAFSLLFFPIERKKKIEDVLWIGIGILIPTSFIHSWLYAMGALPDFYDILLNFIIPIYSRIRPP